MWIKFSIIFVIFTLFIWNFAPSVKWKLLFTIAGAIGIWLALVGKSLPALSPVGRRF